MGSAKGSGQVARGRGLMLVFLLIALNAVKIEKNGRLRTGL